MLTIVRDEGENTVRSHDASLLPAAVGDKERAFWVDLEAPTSAEFELLQNVFRFHPRAVEDAMRPHQRPKVDEYDGYFFLVADETRARKKLPSRRPNSRRRSIRRRGLWRGPTRYFRQSRQRITRSRRGPPSSSCPDG